MMSSDLRACEESQPSCPSGVRRFFYVHTKNVTCEAHESLR